MAYITNKQARHNYEIIETIQGGISLLGTEVKSIRSGKGSLVGAQISLLGGEVYLLNANIPPYQEKNTLPNYDPTRKRKILLNKREMKKLYHTIEGKGLFIIPLSLYNAGRKIKIDIGTGRKKNARDKREELKKRDAERFRKIEE